MIKKNKLFFLFLFLFSFALLAGNAFALEIKDYPNVPGLNPLDDNSGLADVVKYFFGLGIYLAGFLSLVSFAIGAITYSASMGSAQMISSGKDRMKGSLIGFGLVLVSFIIMETINPALTSPQISSLPGLPGVYYHKDDEHEKVAMLENSNTEEILTQGYHSLIYKCADEKQAPLLVWLYPKTDFRGNDDNFSGAYTARISCKGKDNMVSLSGIMSFKTAYETPGIYYCLGGCSEDDCGRNYMSRVNISSGLVQNPFKDKIRGVRIVNEDIGKDDDEKNDTSKFGVIFVSNQDPFAGGNCSDLIIGSKRISCTNVPDKTASSSAVVFTATTKPKEAGSGVSFYSEPYGWDAGAEAGYYDFPNKEQYYKDEYYDRVLYADKDIVFSYDGVDRPDEYMYKCSDSAEEAESSEETESSEEELGEETEESSEEEYGYCSEWACESFQDCPGSIWLKGKYIVALYYKDAEDNWKCQPFKENVSNFKAQFFGTSGSKIKYADIIPLK